MTIIDINLLLASYFWNSFIVKIPEKKETVEDINNSQNGKRKAWKLKLLKCIFGSLILIILIYNTIVILVID